VSPRLQRLGWWWLLVVLVLLVVLILLASYTLSAA